MPVTVSVVIPVYRQAEFLADAVRSVLAQTHADVEAIVVDDASPDSPADVLSAFRDERLRLVAHDANRGLSAARNTGFTASTGELVAFLDADDYFHPEKVARHVDFFQRRPDVDCAYNARWQLRHGVTTVRELSRPPAACGLDALVMGFPFAPSDMVIRRRRFEQVGMFDERLVHYSEDLDINCRLALSGCTIAGIDRALNYRRYHTARRLKVRERLDAALTVLERTFSDLRCPSDVRALRPKARAAHGLIWSFYAFAQDDTALGQQCLRDAVTDDPALTSGRPSGILLEYLVNSFADDQVDHGALLAKLRAQMPADLRWSDGDQAWAIGQGHLRRALRAALWGTPAEVRERFQAAVAAAAAPDESFVNLAAYQLIDVAHESGEAAAGAARARLTMALRTVGHHAVARHLQACYHVNQAFRSYSSGRFGDVLAHVGSAVVQRPHYVTNRGLWAVSVRSLVPGLRARPEDGHA